MERIIRLALSVWFALISASLPVEALPVPLMAGGVHAAVYSDFTQGSLPSSNYTYSGASLKTINDSTGNITYASNNLLLNSATLSTQNVTTNGYSKYIINFTGAGTIALSGTATGTVTGGAGYLKITPTAGTLTLTVSGAVNNAVMAAVTYETSPRPGDQVVTTSAAYYGAPFDYAAGQWSGLWSGYALRSEESRTNLVTYSQAVGGTNWAYSSSSGSTNASTSPDGTNNASSVTYSAQYGTVKQNVITSGSTAYTMSVWLKNVSGNVFIVIQYYDGVVYHSKTVTTTTSWALYSLTFTTAASPTSYVFSVQDNNTSNFGTTLIWGAQLEQGSYVTSYIPTGASSVARAADQYLAAGSLATCLSGNKGSLIIKTSNGLAAHASTLMSANGTIMLGETAGNALTTALTAGLTSSNTATWTGANTSALSWGPSKGVIALNGVYTQDANARSPAADFYLGSTAGASAFYDGRFKSLACYTSQVPKLSLADPANDNGPVIRLADWGMETERRRAA